MKKSSKIILFTFVILLSIIGYKKFFFSFEQLDDGVYFQGPVTSPDGRYTADAYYENYGGATGGANVWVSVTDNETDQTTIIYYSDGKSNFGMKWENNEMLFIKNNEGPRFPESDRSAALRIGKEIYDGYGRACDSLIMKSTYEDCYKN